MNNNIKYNVKILVNGELAGTSQLNGDNITKLLYYNNNLEDFFKNEIMAVFKEESKKNICAYMWVLCDILHDERLGKILTKTDKKIIKTLINKITYKEIGVKYGN